MESIRKKIIELLTERPGLMARDLAKHFDVDRTALNAFLHKNSNEFRKDVDYGWHKVENNEVRIEFSDDWITRNLFEKAILNGMPQISEQPHSVTFVLPVKCRFMLDALALLLSLSNQLADRGINVVLDFGLKGSQFYYYLNRMGFFDRLSQGINIIPKRPQISAALTYNGKSESLMELRPIEPKNEKMQDEVIGKLTECFVSLSDEKYRVAVFTIFSELIGNIKEHSETKLVSFAGLQMYKKTKRIQTVISDSGLGIATTLRSTLRENHPELFKIYSKTTLPNDISLVIAAVGDGHISRIREKGRGLGFARSKNWAQKFNAKLSVRQETFSLEFDLSDLDCPNIKVKENLGKIAGTHFCFDFYI